MNDLISRRDAIDAIKTLPLVQAMGVISTLSSTQRKGKWIPIDDYPHETWKCDQCGCIYEVMMNWTPDFCPNCGADMRGEEDAS